MKKTFVLFILCLVLILGGVTVAAFILHDNRDQVTVTADVQTGDPKTAEGLVATQSANYGGQLLWDMTIPLDRPEDTVTAFSKADDPPDVFYDPDGLRFSLDCPGCYCAYPSPPGTLENALEDNPDLLPMAPIFADVNPRAPKGERRSEQIVVADYLDILPLSVSLLHPEAFPFSATSVRCDLVSDTHSTPEAALTEFFSFPVPSSLIWKFTIQKDGEGRIEELNVTSMVSSPFSLLSVCDGETLYFAFDRRTSAQLSFENVPGGYGIYRMSLRQNPDYPNEIFLDLYTDTLETAFSLPQGAVVLDLNLTPDKKNLLVTYGLGETCTLLALDAGTMKEKQSLPVPLPSAQSGTGYTQDEAGNTISYPVYNWRLGGMPERVSLTGEDFLLLFGWDDFYLFTLGDEGYTFAFSASRERHMENASIRDARAAWDGEKLAIATLDPDRSLHNVTGLTLSVYEEGQLAYQGVYDTSLDALSAEEIDSEPQEDDLQFYPYSNTIQLTPGRELELRWT